MPAKRDHDPDPERGARIASRRALLSLTQRQVADRVGVDPATVHRWERGIEPNTQSLTGLAALFSVSPEWILTGRDTRPATPRGDPPYPAWAEFRAWLETAPEARMLEDWMLEALRVMRLPAGLRPTTETYRRLLFAMLSIEGEANE